MKKTITTILLATFLSTGIFNAARAGVDEYLGEIMLVGFNFCPRGSSPAEGQLLPIASHSALFSLYGCTFGGDCRTTFGLPDLRGRSPVHYGNGPGLPTVAWGEKGGSTSFTLTTAQMPNHSHSVLIKKGRGVQTDATNKFLAEAGIYRTVGAGSSDNGTNLNSTTIGNTGGGQQVIKRSPFTGLKYCVVTQGTFPSRS